MCNKHTMLDKIYFPTNNFYQSPFLFINLTLKTFVCFYCSVNWLEKSNGFNSLLNLII